MTEPDSNAAEENINNEEESISREITQLLELTRARGDAKEIIAKLGVIKSECDKSFENKILVGKSGAYNAILDTLITYISYRDVAKQCLKTLITLMNKQPDLLDDSGIVVILSLLQSDVDVDLKKLALKLAKECCMMHEMNRQKIFNANILENLKEFVKIGSRDVLKDALMLCRALVLDDDVRVEFGKAHEHARAIAMETLCPLTTLLNRYRQDEELIGELMAAMCTLMVRTEFCKKIEDAGALTILKDVALFFKTNEKIIRQCFKLLKAISGNDECKVHIIQNGFAPVIISALDSNKEHIPVTVAGLHCVAALSLRSPENSKALIEAGVAEVIVNIMKVHPDEETIQKTACWAIRNMTSRNKCQGKVFLDLGVGGVLQADLQKFKDIEYDVKAALRDLNCNVHLKEECTSKGAAVASCTK